MGSEYRCPGDMVSLRHFVEHLEGVKNETAFPVYIEEGVGKRFELVNAEFDELGMEGLRG